MTAHLFRQMWHMEYLCMTNCEKNNIKLQEGETIAFKWVNKNKLINMPKNELLTERMQENIEELKVL